MNTNPYKDMIDNRVIPMRETLDNIRERMNPAIGEWNLDANYNLTTPDNDTDDLV